MSIPKTISSDNGATDAAGEKPPVAFALRASPHAGNMLLAYTVQESRQARHMGFTFMGTTRDGDLAACVFCMSPQTPPAPMGPPDAVATSRNMLLSHTRTGDMSADAKGYSYHGVARDALGAEVHVFCMAPCIPREPVDEPAGEHKGNYSLAAIEFALIADDGLQFLRYWMVGHFDLIRKDWPDCPETVFPDEYRLTREPAAA